jgi:hypothetical protein
MATPGSTDHPQEQPPQAADPGAEPGPAAAGHPHNFAVQKDLHQQIRNDPDYDDWEYGTEPLPQEAWPASAPQDKAG